MRLPKSTVKKLPAIAASLAVFLGLACQGREAAPLQFNRDIRPLLSDRCFPCHGPDGSGRKAGLRLDLPANAFGPGKETNTHPIVPGKPGESLVVRRIFSRDDAELMPPPGSHPSLSESEKGLLRRWIEEGAPYESHWSAIPLPEKVAVPAVQQTNWPRNDLDRFVLARLEAEQLPPSPEADRRRWLRRVTYDLTGLPPTVAEVDAFVFDNSAAAYERVVDRLQASPHFGERLATPWLDAARYADSYGYQSDQLSPSWPYRDWVVEAFNRNLPFDQFITEQLAGDLLPNATRAQRLATAFNRLHRQTNEGGSIAEEWRNEYVSDRVHTFGTTFLALTLECCRCHDHKYDPLTQRDYYSLGAFFNSIDENGLYLWGAPNHVPTPSLLLPTPEQDSTMQAGEQAWREQREAHARVVAASEPAFQTWLQTTGLVAAIPGLVTHYTFDEPLSENRFVNALNPGSFSSALHRNELADGKSGHGVEFEGDDEMTFPSPASGMQPWDQYSVVCWLQIPAGLTNAVIWHRTDGTDTGFWGTELTVEEGHLSFVIKRFWPGNALAVRSQATLPTGRWVQVGVSYDGAGEANSMHLFLDGQALPVTIVRDHLYKAPQNGGGSLTFGARMRCVGLKGARLDELRVYSRALAEVEIRHLFDGVALDQALAERNNSKLRPYYLAALSPEIGAARTNRATALRQYLESRNPVYETSVMEELPQPRPSYLLARGRYDAPQNEATRVTRTLPSALPPLPAGAPEDRRGLAQWLTDPRHPLTARVAVNRYWQMLFGRGLVATTENFGVQGAPPTHPELLDWLARDFIRSGWNVKATLRQIVLSATYRQDSKLRPELRERDPENTLLARGPAQRLTAEMLRDTALAVSGLLRDQIGGPPVSPYLPGDLWRESNTMSPAYQQGHGDALYRRSLYTVCKRTAPMPDMAAFDTPSREVCVVKRSPTGSPQQAFVLLNDTQFVEAARVLAEKALQESGVVAAQRVAYVFRRFTGRPPETRETEMLLDLLRQQRAIFTAEPARADRLIAVGETKPTPALNPVELAATTVMVQAVLNLDATVSKR